MSVTVIGYQIQFSILNSKIHSIYKIEKFDDFVCVFNLLIHFILLGSCNIILLTDCHCHHYHHHQQQTKRNEMKLKGKIRDDK